MAATLDLGALSYTMKIKKDGSWSSGFSDAEGDLKNYQEKVKQADEINKTFESSMKGFASSLSATGTSFENIDAKLKLWFMDNKESASAIDINNKAIDSNKAKMAELDEQLTKGNTILKETSTVFGESSEQYKKVENSIVGLEISYKELEEENRRLATSNKEMEESANPSFFDRLKSSVTGVGTGTEEVAEKGKKSSGILSSAFGSVKNVVMNTAIPIMAGMGLQSLIDKATASQQALGQMNTVLNSTHGAAGMTRDALLNLASSQAQVTTYSKGANVATENLLLTFTNIGSKTFPQALTAVNDMSTALGQDTKESAIQLGKALNDPVKGITALSRVGVSFTDQQKNQIAAMEKAGNVAGAQGVILQELQKEFGGSAEAAGKTFGGQLSILKNQLFSVGTSIMSQLMPPLTSFMTMINAHMPQIQSIVSSVINGISTTFKTLGPIVLAIGQDILKIATNIFPQFSSSSGNLGKTLLDLAKGGLTVVKDILDWIAQHGEVVRLAIVGIGTAVAGLKIASKVLEIKSSIDKLREGISGLNGLSKIGGILSNIFKLPPQALLIVGIITAIALVATLIITHWGPISNFFKNLWKDVTNVTSSAWNGIKSFFSGLWTWISNFFKQWGTVILAVIAPFIGVPLLIIQHWSQIKGQLSSIWNGLKAVASSAFNGIKSAIMTVITPIVNGVISLFNKLKPGLTNIFNGVKTVISSIWDGIKTIFLGAILLIIDLVTGNFTQLATDAKSIWTKLGTDLSTIWNTITTAVTTIFNALITFFTGLWSSITTVASTAWNTFYTTVTTIIQKVVTDAKTIFNGIITFFQGLPSTLETAGSDMFSALKNGISSILSTLGSFVQTGFNAVIDFFTGLPSKFLTFGSNMISSLSSGISSVIGTISGVISNGFNGAISFLESLPGKALTWGKDFIDGLIKGITGSVGAIGNAVSGIGDKIRSFLHFSVPDEGPLTDYESWMPDFMKGLSQGIEKNKHLVTDAVKNLAGNVRVGMNLDPAIAGVSTNIKDTNTINNSDGNKQPIQLQLVLGNGKEIASYLVDDINSIQGTVQIKRNRQTIGGNSMDGFTFNGQHNFKDWGLIMESKSILPPPKIKILDTIPYMNSVLDFSTVGSGGEIVYDTRTITVKVALLCYTREELYTVYSQILGWLMDSGKSQLTFDFMTEYFFLAEVNDAPSFDEFVAANGEMEIKFTCESFKYSVDYMGDDIWDTFNFLTDYTQYSNTFTITGPTTVVMNNNGRLITPVINVDTSMTVTYGGQTYNLVAGDNIPYGLKLLNGENDLVFNGNGTAKIIFRWEAL
jgi:phage-related protein